MPPRKKVPGNESHRDEETMLFQREQAYRRHILEGESLRSIARSFDVSITTVANDVKVWQKMLREELPNTFEQWQMKLWQEYTTMRDEADELYRTAESGFVRVQALKLKMELVAKVEGLFGVPKAVKAPAPASEAADDEIVWGS